MLDPNVIKETIDLFEESFDKMETAEQIKKNVHLDIKSFAENSELNSKNLLRVFKDYCSWRKGKLKWGDSGEDDDFISLQISIMDEATAK